MKKGKTVPANASQGTIDSAEVARFTRLADAWWAPEGAFRPLHALNPARLGFIRTHLLAHFHRAAEARSPFTGLSALDIGCGGGLVAEPMARMGFTVTGIDAGGETVAAARTHAETQGLSIDYREDSAEHLAQNGARFDVVLALEILEHVADVGLFLEAASALVAPKGALILSTLNRTPEAFLFAILGAEYVLGWLPRATHQWRKFLRPSELAAGLRPNGFAPRAIAGLVYDPWHRSWGLSRNIAINYLVFAARA